jgi:hypothetical protein
MLHYGVGETIGTGVPGRDPMPATISPPAIAATKMTKKMIVNHRVKRSRDFRFLNIGMTIISSPRQVCPTAAPDCRNHALAA